MSRWANRASRGRFGSIQSAQMANTAKLGSHLIRHTKCNKIITTVMVKFLFTLTKIPSDWWSEKCCQHEQHQLRTLNLLRWNLNQRGMSFLQNLKKINFNGFENTYIYQIWELTILQASPLGFLVENNFTNVLNDESILFDCLESLNSPTSTIVGTKDGKLQLFQQKNDNC